MNKNFQKRKEDFVCQNCQEKVSGNGYTNHCPKCFYSKHVDINPGDRLEKCHGLMKPVEIYKKKEKYIIIHQCLKCKKKKKDHFRKEDNFESFLEIYKKIQKN